MPGYTATHTPLQFLNRQQLNRNDDFRPQANSIWKIDSGFIRSFTWDEEGNVTTLGIWGPGELVSTALITIDPYFMECLSPVYLHYVANITNSHHPEVSHTRYANELLLNRAQRTEELFCIAQHRSTQTRLETALHWLTKRFGVSTAEGRLLPLKITHQQLSDLIGSTRVTVSRMMITLQKEQKIMIVKRKIIMLYSDDMLSSQV